MHPHTLRDKLRAFLNSGQVSLSDIERSTSLNRSWLSKFRRGELDNVTINQLAAVHDYREGLRSSRKAASQ